MPLSQFFPKLIFFLLLVGKVNAQGRPFIFTWKVDEPDSYLNIVVWDNIYEVDYLIDYGDGTEPEQRTMDIYHRYSDPGIYTVKVWGKLPNVVVPRTLAKHMHSLISWGDTQWKTMQGAFKDCNNMTYEVSDPINDVPNLDSVTSMMFMFQNARSINGDFSGWDVSNVRDMRYLFKDASSFNGNISTWDVSKVRHMDGLFEEATLFNGDISLWDVGIVMSMSNMFSGAQSFEGDLSAWNVQRVTDFSNMFKGAVQFSSDVSNWDVGSGNNFSRMFVGALHFSSDVSGWDVSHGQNFSNMFAGCQQFNSAVSDWDMRKAQDLSGMFIAASSFDQSLGSWQLLSVTSLNWILSKTNLSIANYDATLKGWSQLPVNQLPKGISVGVDGLKHSMEGTSYRTLLMNRSGWQFWGDSLDW